MNLSTLRAENEKLREALRERSKTAHLFWNHARNHYERRVLIKGVKWKDCQQELCASDRARTEEVSDEP